MINMNFIRIRDYLDLPKVEIIDADFCYYNITNEIIAMNIDDARNYAEEFIEFAAQINPIAREIDIVLLSLLHEFGHHETYYLLTEEEEVEEKFMRMLYQGIGENVTGYFNLPSERMATEWALDFAEKNIDKIKELDIYE
jgi:hypothetical protein